MCVWDCVCGSVWQGVCLCAVCVCVCRGMRARTQVCYPHLVLELGQLAGQVGDEFHGGLELLLQVPQLVLLALRVAAHQGHGPHPGEPVQVSLLEHGGKKSGSDSEEQRRERQSDHVAVPSVTGLPLLLVSLTAQ